ncbi:MAG TPA: ABC transporter ATP-binding protein [Candidatus Nanopelagicaceae bacterium]|nr:ABC transporter ATP-binding protein [Candidatus Nanopelagicaceae bacterium]
MIDFEDVTVRLGGHTIVNGVDLHIMSGGWTCLIGPNGAGKTTLLRSVIGGLKHSGRIRVDGQKVTGSHQSRVAYVSQRPGVPEGMSVAEYVGLGRFPFGPARTDSRGVKVVADLLEELNLDDNSDQAITSLSGGEFQRCVIARALAQESLVLLLDEPTSALDLHRQIAVLDVIDRRRREGVTVLSTMHDITLAGMYADKFVVMDHGSIVVEGAANDVANGVDLLRTFGGGIDVLKSLDGLPVVFPRREMPEHREQ